jgi:PBP1b-binding outer membrane lipoprotein LpoB
MPKEESICNSKTKRSSYPTANVTRVLQTIRQQTDVELTPASMVSSAQTKKNKKQIPWPLVREGTIPTDRPPLVDEI